MHAAGTLQVADITAAPPLEDLIDHVDIYIYIFLFQRGEIPFSSTILKKGKIVFQQLYFSTGIFVLA